ncbi:hypothetical protein BFP72_17055 [Reichenbachiella sp. 5M10]|uniref:SDR family oxidoreductase n=1 Tax=Reichenbachiella sp. 5M10 TaxID=1889772 RepID=UPI000C14C197|nr:SDR family oxidoreductase [Reichenbachiella sp. 5M10]PIB36989.1 hypothetical protein BFP72_17055 [Reichenbachiella sp. 5M10]
MNDSLIILITGASSGIGQACFDYLFALGYRVYGTSRKKNEDNPYLLQMDVTHAKSITHAVNHIITKEGQIDVLINNAGISVLGSAENTKAEDARQSFETNFWGAVQVTNAVLPHMRRARRGKIINISSLAGLFAIPFQSYYSASKHALEGYSESLRMELQPFDISVTLVEPGDFRTSISQHRIVSAVEDDTDYKTSFAQAHETIIKGELLGEDSIKIARLIEHIINKRKPKLRYAVGKPLDLLAAKLKRILPHTAFQWIISKHYRLNK